ncbi:MAG: Asp-tRNA(Asn)/Glu-tRNA(Gln) amidotransferase subunit GatA, partial [Clostridia bacterium]|nr:Asp-tRNA(Asn)/Glu-tRNA(Gln) amidotransferase subunit GatA [Clostridia bacterium]
YSVIAAAEASSNLARFDGVHYGLRAEGDQNLRELYAKSRSAGFCPETKRRILFGTYVLTGDRRAKFYHRALQVREDVFRAMRKTVSEYDLVLSPATPSSAFRRNTGLAPEEMYRADLCTVYASLASLPALAVPMGKDEQGLPVAVQLTAGPCAENLLFEVAGKLEVYCEKNGL